MDSLYAEALKLAENQPASPAAISRVAAKTSVEAARWAFSQWALRKRGAAKFSRAAEMLFDPEGLEMATHEAVAAYHASLFPPGEFVLDLTAGIGADLIALARRGEALGLEIDKSRAEVARHNLAVHGVKAEVLALPFLPEGRGGRGRGMEGFELVETADPVGGGCIVPPSDRERVNYKQNLHPPASSSKTNHLEEGEKPLPPQRLGRKGLGMEGFELVEAADSLPGTSSLCRSRDRRSIGFIFADPARRSSGRRFTDPSEFQPNPLEILDAFKDCDLGVIKLSPMLPDDFLESLGPCLEFVSFGGECREALVIFGKQAKPGRFAVQVESGAQLEADDLYLEEAPEPSAYLYEADPAAIRAHALGNLCEQFNLKALGDSNGYLTGDTEIQSPWLTGFQVLESGRFDAKTLKKRLAELGSATPVLKQRGTKLDLQKLQKQMILKGKRNLESAFYAVGNSVRHSILERLR